MSEQRERRGLFIVLEGGEGAGKSTQLALLSDWLEELGLSHRTTREPGGTEVGEEIRRLLLHRGDLPVPPETELFLILAARAAFVREVVAPALERGEIVVSDRFDLSTLAYQGYGRELGVERILPLNAFATDGVEPDLYVLLDVPVEAGLARTRERGTGEDRIESSGRAFLERVHAGYRELARDDDHVALIDGEGEPEAVQARVRELLRDRFPETFTDG